MRQFSHSWFMGSIDYSFSEYPIPFSFHTEFEILLEVATVFNPAKKDTACGKSTKDSHIY